VAEEQRQAREVAKAKAAAPAAKAAPKAAAKAAEPSPARDDKQERIAEREQKKARERELDKKQKRLKELEDKIAGAEAEIAALNEKLASDHGGDWSKLHALVADKDKAEQRLKSWMAEWERLGEELQS
jgi:hypothetical protein